MQHWQFIDNELIILEYQVNHNMYSSYVAIKEYIALSEALYKCSDQNFKMGDAFIY